MSRLFTVLAYMALALLIAFLVWCVLVTLFLLAMPLLGWHFDSISFSR